MPGMQRATHLKRFRFLCEETQATITLPDAYEIHEYAIMERFCCAVQDEALRNELLDLIRGSGAFRRFKNFIDHKGIDKDWYAYRESALVETAREFLEEHKIPFIDDSK